MRPSPPGELYIQGDNEGIDLGYINIILNVVGRCCWYKLSTLRVEYSLYLGTGKSILLRSS